MAAEKEIPSGEFLKSRSCECPNPGCGRLRDDPERFSELRRSIEGISQRMPLLTRKELQRDGVDNRPLGSKPSRPIRAITSVWPTTQAEWGSELLLAQGAHRIYAAG